MTNTAQTVETQAQGTPENLPLTERTTCVLCGLPVPPGESPAALVKAFAGVMQPIGNDKKGNAQYYRQPSWAYQGPVCPGCAEREKRKIAWQRPFFLVAALAVLAALVLFVIYGGGYILTEFVSGGAINMGLALACVVFLALLRVGFALLILSLERVFSKAERLLVKNGFKQYQGIVLSDIKWKAPSGTPDNLLFVLDEEAFGGLDAANRRAMINCGKSV